MYSANCAEYRAKKKAAETMSTLKVHYEDAETFKKILEYNNITLKNKGDSNGKD